MDDQRFDRFAQALAGSKSRRKVIAAAAAGLFATAIGRNQADAQGDCPAGYDFCDGVCRFLENDYNHCGECGNSCGDEACIDGACAACESTGLTTCWDPIGETNYCADTTTSWNDCGACGNRCTTGPCEAGVCVSTADCDEGLTECQGQCVDLNTSVYHCGACGNACMGVPGPGQSSIGVCVEGGCEVVCLEGYTACPGDAVDFCADLATDSNNCGECGNVCAEGTCADGVCVDGDIAEESIASVSVFSNQAEALAFAQQVEYASRALFRQGLAQFQADAFERLPRDTRTRLGKMRDHDKAHVDIVNRLLWDVEGIVAEIGEPTYTFESVSDFLAKAYQLKELTTAAYAIILPSLTSSVSIAPMGEVAIVEGRHAAWLAVRAGEVAFTDATERVLTRVEIEAELAALSA